MLIQRSVTLAAELGQQDTVIVLDQAIYSKVMIISGNFLLLHYNRGVRIDKLVLEALCHILWNSYQQHDDLNELVTVHEVCKSFKCSGFHTENLDELLCLSEVIALKDNFTQYCSQLQSPVAT